MSVFDTELRKIRKEGHSSRDPLPLIFFLAENLVLSRREGDRNRPVFSGGVRLVQELGDFQAECPLTDSFGHFHG